MEINSNESKGYFSVATEHQVIPEARDITWDDAFFENENDIGTVAVFDFEYNKMVYFLTQVKAVTQISFVVIATLYCGVFFYAINPLLTFLPLGIYILSLAPFFLREQVRWEVYAQHVAVTRDGIRYVNDRQKSCWGLWICDQGKRSKTVPYDKITDCDICEPAGNSCLCIPNVLVTVHIDTASSGGESKRHELVISGLKDAYSFKKLVWAMKRSKEYEAPSVKASAAEISSMLNNTVANGCSQEIPGLLRDIRDELRKNNELIREQRENKDTTHSTIQIV